jgi:hypothetical protein
MRYLISMRFAPYGETPRLAARHGLAIADADSVWHESFGPRCWRGGGRGAQIGTAHDGTQIGEVVVIAARDRWYEADCVVETDDPKILERIRVGQPVSVGFDDLDVDDDFRTNVRRFLSADLKHIAILARGEVPAYAGARITSVVEAKLKPAATASRASGARLTGEQGHAELYRRLAQDDSLEWGDAFAQLVDRVDAAGSWWLPPSRQYLDRSNRAAQLAA